MHSLWGTVIGIHHWRVEINRGRSVVRFVVKLLMLHVSFNCFNILFLLLLEASHVVTSQQTFLHMILTYHFFLDFYLLFTFYLCIFNEVDHVKIDLFFILLINIMISVINLHEHIWPLMSLVTRNITKIVLILCWYMWLIGRIDKKLHLINFIIIRLYT